MDSFVSSLFALLFGLIGASILYLIKRGKTSFKEILTEQTLLSDLVGFAVIVLIGLIIYFSN